MSPNTSLHFTMLRIFWFVTEIVALATRGFFFRLFSASRAGKDPGVQEGGSPEK